MIVAGTGHRPERLGLDYSEKSLSKLSVFLCWHLERMTDLSLVVSGMAQGFDTALALAALCLGVPLACYLPFDGHGSNWPESSRERQERILALASEVVVVTPGPYRKGDGWKYIRRDKHMVDRADLLLALWDGVEAGGTYQTVRYAQEKRVVVRNLWQDWSAV